MSYTVFLCTYRKWLGIVAYIGKVGRALAGELQTFAYSFELVIMYI